MCAEVTWKHPAVSTGELSPLQRHSSSQQMMGPELALRHPSGCTRHLSASQRHKLWLTATDGLCRLCSELCRVLTATSLWNPASDHGGTAGTRQCCPRYPAAVSASVCLNSAFWRDDAPCRPMTEPPKCTCPSLTLPMCRGPPVGTLFKLAYLWNTCLKWPTCGHPVQDVDGLIADIHDGVVCLLGLPRSRCRVCGHHDA